MIVEYSDELDKQSFKESAGTLRLCGIKVDGQYDDFVSLGTLDNPSVALDGKALARLPNGDLISGLFSHPKIPLITSYDGLFNAWHHLPGTWPCAIDTLIHLRGQRESSVLNSAKEVLDIGCGTGAAGAYAAVKHPDLHRLDFSDIEPNCGLSARDNLHFMSTVSKSIAAVSEFYACDGFEHIVSKYDSILVSAVPATPVLVKLNRPINPLFEGTNFLENILRGAPYRLNKGGKMLLSHSSAGENQFNEFAAKYGAKAKVVYEREAAFRTEFLGNQSWVDALVEQGGMRKEDKRGFPYWHTVRVKEVSYE